MTDLARLKLLERPVGKIDVALDTDTFNEIDDQFALSYLVKRGEKCNTLAICAAPFFNSHSESPGDGMEKSYDEILRLLTLLSRDDLKERVHRGSPCYLPDERTPVDSPAARALAQLAMEHSPEHPLYIVTIGAITNVASAFLLEPAIADRCVVVWLGGNSLDWPHIREFNLYQDVAAARVVFDHAALVLLPARNVISELRTTGPELSAHLSGKNALCDFLCGRVFEEVKRYNAGKCWSRVIWDIAAVAWLLDEKFLSDRIIHAPIPQYDFHYSFDPRRPLIRYVYGVNRDALFEDLFDTLAK